MNVSLPDDISRLLHARHGDPFSVLGRHVAPDGTVLVRVLLPGAQQVTVLDAQDRPLGALALLHAAGLFAGPCPAPADYRLDVLWHDGTRTRVYDPYRFGPLLGDMDLWLLAEGTHLRPHEALGGHPRTHEGVAGTGFAVWAPNAQRVSVVGDFNGWDGRCHAMRLRREAGVWEIFLPGVAAGARYKYEIVGVDGALLPLKADPCALATELRPGTASVVAALPPRVPANAARQAANAADAPISIYEVHLSSWRRKADPGDRWLDWDALAEQLIPYALDLGFTHLELLPISEFPFDGSWGYQPIGLYAPTARFTPAASAEAGHGDPVACARFVARCHAAGLGVLLDWVPAHFPSDAHGLARFDGTALYEYADPREGFHHDWNTLIYNFGRTEVRNFLVGNALYWLERMGADGLRVDAVASMLYRDYSRKHGEWVPNAHGGRENLEAIAFLKRLNEVVGSERPEATTIAEESTSFPGVTRPTSTGGLGFHHKWNMGWMHDTLRYFGRDPVHRPYHHHELTFSLVYAFSEHFVLPFSHDEVVHGKGSLLDRMPGDRWQQFANLRACYGYMWGHPGKKLLFMGCEFAQAREWNFEQSLDWHLLQDPLHAGVQALVRDLNRVLRKYPALHQRDGEAAGFEWLEADDAQRSVLAFARHGREDGQLMLVVCNLTPTVHRSYRLGVPRPGRWHERINTDSAYYGGSNVGTPWGVAGTEPVPAHGRAHSVVLTLPPLSTVFLEWTP